MSQPLSPSPELAAITRRIMAAMLSGQGQTVANFLASTDPFLFCGSATPGTIAVSDVRRAMIGRADEFAFGQRSTVSLKGTQGTHVLFQLEWSP